MTMAGQHNAAVGMPTGRPNGDRSEVEHSLDDAVASGLISGAVAVLTDPDQELFAGSFGVADPVTSRRYARGDLFRIASALKVWTSILLLQLVEQDLLDLDDPVGHYLPEFDAIQVLAGFDGDQPIFAEPVRSPTIRELCAHLGGLSYAFSSELNRRYGDVVAVPRGFGVLGALTQFPRTAQPGREVLYGTGFDWIGLVIERITGDRLEDRIRTNLLDPIRMTDTRYTLDPTARARVVPVLARDGAGAWAPSSLPFDYPDQPEFCQGGGHMYTTPSDYAKLMRVLLSEGKAPGGRILTPASVDLMFRPLVPQSRIEALHTAAPAISADITLGVGDRWGMGMMVNDHDLPGRRRAGSGGWAGLWNTFFWVDRSSGLAGALFLQCLPFGEPGVVRAFEQFENDAYTHIGASRRQ